MARVKLSLGSGAEDMLIELIPMFLEDSQILLSKLEDAITIPDFEAIKIASHTLKGSSASLGLYSLSEKAQTVELLSRDEKILQTKAKIGELKANYAQVTTALKKLYPFNPEAEV
jgi:HPt (histidine-containing phosphotransfer) domain-containing protein